MYNTSKTVEYLSKWYEKEKRDLPWRKTKDPYKIWLSEIMLQQTQVNTVIPYFNRWIKEYPEINDAAQADEAKLLKLWEGLGYYNRCRNFHKAIKIVVQKYGGKIPEEMNEFKKLPGVGNYIAAAVLSIAFQKPFPALDGNIFRVMSRMLCLKKNSLYNKKVINNHLYDWMKYNTASEINQSLMDLGSLVCRPNQAHCYKCPLAGSCKGHATGNPEKYPERIKNGRIPVYNVVTGVLWKDHRFLILKRDSQNHLGGLWEFPGGKMKENENGTDALSREIYEECGTHVYIDNKIGTIQHAYSHFSINMTAYHCHFKDDGTIHSSQKYQWITPQEIKDFPFPRANHKIFSILSRNDWNI